MSKAEALESLEKIQVLLGELGYTLTSDGYHKDYGKLDGSAVRIIPMFDKGLSTEPQYTLTALSVAGHTIVPIVPGQQVDFSKIPSECIKDITRMLAELSPGVITSLKENFILTMKCSSCGKQAESFFNNKGVIACLECLGFKL